MGPADPGAGDERRRYIPLSPPLWIPASAGMTKLVAGRLPHPKLGTSPRATFSPRIERRRYAC